MPRAGDGVRPPVGQPLGHSFRHCFRSPLRFTIGAGKGARRIEARAGGGHTGMIILRIFANAVIMAGEVAAVAALAAFAFYHPFVFAGVTAA